MSDKIIEISSFEDLRSIGNAEAFPMNGNYEQTCDIDASESRKSERGFWSIQDQDDDGMPIPFSGTYNGRGHSIKNLFINSPKPNKVGMFASLTKDAIVRNVNIVDADVTGKSEVGILAGHSHGWVSNCNVRGQVRGEKMVGGLIGSNMGYIELGRVLSGSVIGESMVGGLVGLGFGAYVVNELFVSECDEDYLIDYPTDYHCGKIHSCESCADVRGKECVGGLMGASVCSLIYWCQVKEPEASPLHIEVDGVSSVGGAVGSCIDGFIYSCDVKANVVGERFVGGIVGSSDSTLGSLVAIVHSKYSGNQEGSLLGYYGDVRAFNARDILEKVHEYRARRGIDNVEFLYHY